MPLFPTPISTFPGVYIGTSGQSSPLTQILSLTTEDTTTNEDLPAEYIVSQDAPIQIDMHQVSFTIRFLGTADEVYTVARGAASTNANPDTTAAYAVCLVSQNQLGPDNYYFPSLFSQIKSSYRYSKKSPIITEIKFYRPERSVADTIIFKGTYTTIASAMGDQAPF
jgi:hypothetical protein